jgi:heat shock protein HslJ
MSNQSIAPGRAARHARLPGSAGALAAAAVALLTACATLAACTMPNHPDSAAPPNDPFNPAATQLLDDTAWTLASWRTADGHARDIAGDDGKTPDEKPGESAGAGAPTLVFSTATGQRRASGFTGCNRFAAPYSLKGGALSFGPLVATKTTCAGAPGKLEHDYLDALAHIAKTGVQWTTPRELLIVKPDGEMLRFTAAKH